MKKIKKIIHVTAPLSECYVSYLVPSSQIMDMSCQLVMAT